MTPPPSPGSRRYRAKRHRLSSYRPIITVAASVLAVGAVAAGVVTLRGGESVAQLSTSELQAVPPIGAAVGAGPTGTSTTAAPITATPIAVAEDSSGVVPGSRNSAAGAVARRAGGAGSGSSGASRAGASRPTGSGRGTTGAAHPVGGGSTTSSGPAVSTTSRTQPAGSQPPATTASRTTATGSTATRTSGTKPGSTPPADTGDPSGFAAEVVRLTNEQRLANGCRALTANAVLGRVATAHSQDMADRGYFDHNTPDGLSPFDRMTAAGYRYSFAAENIAAGQTTPQAVMASWMASPGHRANILNCDLTEIGVGYVAGGSYHSYWTQNFGTPA